MQSLLTLAETAAGICCHSDAVQPGSIFIAIRGRITDGNLYAGAAAAKGACAIITDAPENLPPLPVPVIAVPDARKALAFLAAHRYHHPSRELSLAGVTGTNGKTTIVAMLEAMYRQAGYPAGMIGTVRVNLGSTWLPASLTTPDALSLQCYLREMRRQGVTHAAMEISAQGMELNRVDHVRFACGILSNISPDHLDFHGGFKEYLAAKQLFPSFLNGAPLIINQADPYCREVGQQYADGPVISAAVHTAADICADITYATSCGSVFQLIIADSLRHLPGLPDSLQLQLAVPGVHNVENALFSAIAALLQGVPFPAVRAALAAFRGVERRFTVKQHAGCTVIDDTALNPGSINAVFQTLKQFNYNRLIVVNAIRGQRGTAINIANALALAHWRSQAAFTLIITASCDQTAAGDRVNLQENRAFLGELDRQQIQYIYTDTLVQAIHTAWSAARPGDLLLLIGAQGMDHGYSLLTAPQLENLACAKLQAQEEVFVSLMS